MEASLNPNAYFEMAKTEATHWWFVGRRTILASEIAKLDLPPNARILEVGSGTGGNLNMLSTFGRVSSMEMDATARSLAIEKTGGRFDIRSGYCPTDIPFHGEKFDLICLFDVLEHIEEDLETLISMKNFLAGQGRIIVTVPAYQWLWGAHDDFLHHKRRYSAAGMRKTISLTGFRLEKMSYFNTLLFPLAAVVRLKDRFLKNSLASGTGSLPTFINTPLRQIFGTERFLLGKGNLPYGMSLLCVLSAK